MNTISTTDSARKKNSLISHSIFKKLSGPAAILNSQFYISRSGTTLIELIIYLAILSMIIGTALPMLFSATENRLLQQTVSIVEQNGTQILQNISQNVRLSERILSPAIGQSGSVLALSTASGGLNPIIIGSSSGSVVIVEHYTRELISSSQVAITDFVVKNTSTSVSRPSVNISFRASRTIRLQQPHSYSRRFETLVNLLPDDVPYVDGCSCALPACASADLYQWQVCETGVCVGASTSLECP